LGVSLQKVVSRFRLKARVYNLMVQGFRDSGVGCKVWYIWFKAGGLGMGTGVQGCTGKP